MEIILSEWNRWFSKYVEPVFVSEGRDHYYQKPKENQAPFYPKFWVAEEFYERVKDDNRFDDELKRYFAFLYSCGFFMEHFITFSEWLEMKNWQNPRLKDENDQTILELLKMSDGLSVLKEKLRWLPFIDRQEGF